MEYQDPGAADATSNQEGTSVDENGDGVKAGTAHQSLPQPTSLVSVMTVSDVSDVLCAHNCPAEYCHDHEHNSLCPSFEGQVHYPQRPSTPTRNPREQLWTHHWVHPQQRQQ